LVDEGCILQDGDSDDECDDDDVNDNNVNVRSSVCPLVVRYSRTVNKYSNRV